MTSAAGILAVLLAAANASPAAALGLGVTTGSPADVTDTSATFRATVTASLLGTTVRFQYGTSTAYGSTTATSTTGLIGVGEDVRIPVTGLKPSTTYHLRVVATDGLTTSTGRDVSFGTQGTSSGPGPAPTPAPAPADPPPDAAPPATDILPAPVVPAVPLPATGLKGPASGSDAAPAARDDAAATALTEDAHYVPATDAPAPLLGEKVSLSTVRGTVKVLDVDGGYVPLDDPASLATGTVVDARHGTVELVSALDGRGGTQTGRFWGGIFEVRQAKDGRGMTQLVLRGGDFAACRPPAAAGASVRARAAASKPPRSLWGSDSHGRFQTRGRGSVATVRGTRWLTEDRCDGTLTRVVQGAVAVRDLAARRTVVVKAGHRHLARLAG